MLRVDVCAAQHGDVLHMTSSLLFLHIVLRAGQSEMNAGVRNSRHLRDVLLRLVELLLQVAG